MRFEHSTENVLSTLHEGPASVDVRFAVVGVAVRISLRHPGCRTDRPGFRFLSGTLRVLGGDPAYRDRKNTHVVRHATVTIVLVFTALPQVSLQNHSVSYLVRHGNLSSKKSF